MTKQKRAQRLLRYRGLLLDDFQQEALHHVQQNTSLLVSAPTGTGKTLIASYLIDRTLKTGSRLIYTAPIKALVHQKFDEFCSQCGGGQIGLATGDLTLNAAAPILVVTTEVFRNMLRSDDVRIPSFSWVVFDELHYLDHVERGSVWEESILLKPASMRLLGLSATVPNIDGIAQWIRHVHNEPVAVIQHHERAVPLHHHYFNSLGEITPQNNVLEHMAAADNTGAMDLKGGYLSWDDLGGDLVPDYADSSRFLQLTSYLRRNRLFPAIFFSFNRRDCEQKAKETARQYNLLPDHQKRAVQFVVEKQLRRAGIAKKRIPGFDDHLRCWLRGTAVHHAGLLPVLRRIAEQLLSDGLIRIIYATETFAVGVNMPVRTVCFGSLTKFDGRRRRYLTQQEYFQMAGRAGRRGRDKQGTVISMASVSHLAKHPAPVWDEAHLEPVNSRFSFSYNLILNMLQRFPDRSLEDLLAHTFSVYQNQRPRRELVDELNHQRTVLERLGYVSGTTLTAKGRLACNLYVHTILLTELVYHGVLERANPVQLGRLAGSLMWERRSHLQALPGDPWLLELEVIRDTTARRAQIPPEELAVFQHAAALPIGLWAERKPLEQVLQKSAMEAGDFVQLVRRSMDLLRQVQSAAASPELQQSVEQTLQLLDRDVVKVRV